MIENLILEDKLNIAYIYVKKIGFRQSQKDISEIITYQQIVYHNLVRQYEELLQRKGTKDFIKNKVRFLKKEHLMQEDETFNKQMPQLFFKIETVKTIDWNRIANQGTKIQYSLMLQSVQEKSLAVKNIQWNADNQLQPKHKKEYYRIMPMIWQGLNNAGGFYNNDDDDKQSGMYECQICWKIRGVKNARASIEHLYNCSKDLITNFKWRIRKYAEMLEQTGYQQERIQKKNQEFIEEEQEYIECVAQHMESIAELALTYGLMRKYSINPGKIKHLAHAIQIAIRISKLYQNLEHNPWKMIIARRTWKQEKENSRGNTKIRLTRVPQVEKEPSEVEIAAQSDPFLKDMIELGQQSESQELQARETIQEALNVQKIQEEIDEQYYSNLRSAVIVQGQDVFTYERQEPFMEDVLEQSQIIPQDDPKTRQLVRLQQTEEFNQHRQQQRASKKQQRQIEQHSAKFSIENRRKRKIPLIIPRQVDQFKLTKTGFIEKQQVIEPIGYRGNGSLSQRSIQRRTQEKHQTYNTLELVNQNLQN
ncbi:UNKNOWN [Stylonychia lemnae]|uniref:Uncharacterized protein n=1 Tax=Stylonychia lemnae TaxID=5949 RepID=A0A078ABM2_STYLE|nr:UNKNOWN [Stylonychia lemnae]|eukprot:CDW79584.1 UNKNOWN [Stylonychia lemnae]